MEYTSKNTNRHKMMAMGKKSGGMVKKYRKGGMC